jgi:hypothetical protein
MLLLSLCTTSLVHTTRLVLLAYVAIGCIKCSRCFRIMFQVFHMYDQKNRFTVVYVAMATYACCKCLLQMFQKNSTIPCCFVLLRAHVAIESFECS